MALSPEVRRFLDNLAVEAGRFEGTLPEIGAKIGEFIRLVEARGTSDVTEVQRLAKDFGLTAAVVRRALSSETTAEQASAEMARMRSQFEAPLATAAQTQATTSAAEAIETQSSGQLTFARDATGNVATDLLGRPIIEGDINGQTMVYDENVGGMAPAFLAEAEEGPPFIGGFPEDYSVRDFKLEEAVDKAFLPGTPVYEAVRGAEYTPRYYDFDQWRDFATKSPEYQTMVQAQLIEAGLMDPDDYIPGTWTFDAARAMEFAMFESNATGGRKTWVQVLRERAQGRAEAGLDEETKSLLKSRRLVLPAFRSPDYASLSTSVKDLFRNQLGREPADWEVALLADQLNTDYRAAYDADVSALTAEFEAGNRAIIDSDATGAAAIQSAGTVGAVDPVARLRDRFETKYASEFELGEDRIAERQNVGNVFSILTKTNNAMSGGMVS